MSLRPWTCSFIKKYAITFFCKIKKIKIPKYLRIPRCDNLSRALKKIYFQQNCKQKITRRIYALEIYALGTSVAFHYYETREVHEINNFCNNQ